MQKNLQVQILVVFSKAIPSFRVICFQLARTAVVVEIAYIDTCHLVLWLITFAVTHVRYLIALFVADRYIKSLHTVHNLAEIVVVILLR